MMVPEKSDLACSPPPGFLMVSKWLDIHTQDLSKSWVSGFLFIQNDWHLLDKWGKLKELTILLHVRAEDLLKMLNLPNVDTFHYEDQIQEALDHIFVVEVKALELECMEEGFIRGFLKGACLVQCKTGAEIEGLTPS
ncbi:hypothetical protein IEQ34_017926 [Dendrobium chrysotoxum]|uniref:Uncharacterized protein n=1 Tax=Dendrobium chrysotoxum TaxID=161865 RepID=A0AAV7GDG9_DENCH|nr:hypothetical protein IEQ34_017926 [Dendrobium chrysotoxum]